MSLRLEQVRALSYVRKRGTDASLASIRERVAGTYAELATLVGAVPADVARERRATSSWSIQEVVDHLVESDRPAVEQLRQLLAGHSVEVPIPASLQSPEPLGTDWQTLVRELAAVHHDILRLLDGASDALPSEATAPVQMVVKCAASDGGTDVVSWVERFDWKGFSILLHAHNREHIAQIQRILMG
jgi:hypothetical protein